VYPCGVHRTTQKKKAKRGEKKRESIRISISWPGELWLLFFPGGEKKERGQAMGIRERQKVAE